MSNWGTVSSSRVLQKLYGEPQCEVTEQSSIAAPQTHYLFLHIVIQKHVLVPLAFS